MIVSVIHHILIYFLIQCDQVHDEACLLFETCFLKYFHIQSPPATSPTMGMGWALLAAIPQVFDDDVCNDDDTGNLKKAKTSATCSCPLVCNCDEIVKLSSLQLFKCSVSEYQMVRALCTDGPGLECNTCGSRNGCRSQKLQLHIFSSEKSFRAT